MPFLKHNIIFAGRYQLIDLIEESSPVEVWKAKDSWADNTLVVLKIYASAEKLEDAVISQFRNIFSLSNKLSHPHLQKISHFEISKIENAAYLLLPYFPAGSLEQQFNEEEAGFTERQLAQILGQIGSALQALHEQHPPILHQAIRPDNILLSQQEFFLLSLPALYSQNRGESEKMPFPPRGPQKAYASPEFFNPNQAPDTSADIFSLGVCMYVMCTKTIPWEGAGGEKLLTDGELPRLPKHYSPELNELLQECMAANSDRRPGAEELSLRGKHFLETGKWDLSDKGNGKGKSLKRLWPFLLAVAVLSLFIVSAFWEYQHNPLEIPKEKFQKMVSSGHDGQESQEVDAMLITMLEEERNDLARRNLELEKQNRQLLYFDSVNTVTLRNMGKSVDKTYVQLKTPQDNKIVEKSEVAEKAKANLLSSPPPTASTIKPKENMGEKELEKQLNKIADPKLSGKARSSWKNETMAHFSEGSIQIVDESGGTPKNYSAGIFLNLLYNVPHQIVVKEVKTNQQNKVTELRLTMEAKR